MILVHHRKELLGRHELSHVDSKKLAADLMAPTASEAQVKLRDAAWAKRDEVWAAYHLSCREYEEAQQEEPPAKKRRDARKADRDKNLNDELQKAAEDEKERAAFFEKMQDKFDADREAFKRSSRR